MGASAIVNCLTVLLRLPSEEAGIVGGAVPKKRASGLPEAGEDWSPLTFHAGQRNAYIGGRARRPVPRTLYAEFSQRVCKGIAEPNMVVIAEGTRRLLGNLFDLEDLGA